jgi:hypothetical protein
MASAGVMRVRRAGTSMTEIPFALLLCVFQPLRAESTPETARYLRPAGESFVTECTFSITKTMAGWSVTSRTERGKTVMEVEARYAGDDRLLGASATLTSDGKIKSTTVEVKEGKATVKREGEKALEFDVPAGTIVTSAPDWTDVFLLCRRYDRDKKGKQEFPALWIHPTQPPRRLTFSIERQGSDAIAVEGRKIELDRYLIRIRGNSGYVAWADSQGKMIRLVPLPFKVSASGMTLQGFEKTARGLKPSE